MFLTNLIARILKSDTILILRLQPLNNNEELKYHLIKSFKQISPFSFFLPSILPPSVCYNNYYLLFILYR